MTTATLGFKIDSSQAKGAATDLDRLTGAAQRAETGEQKLGAAARTAAAAQAQQRTATSQLAAATTAQATSATAAATATARQTATTTAQVTASRTATVALAQQAAAIGVQQAATVAGFGAIAPLLTSLGPLVAGIGAAVASAFLLMWRQVRRLTTAVGVELAGAFSVLTGAAARAGVSLGIAATGVRGLTRQLAELAPKAVALESALVSTAPAAVAAGASLGALVPIAIAAAAAVVALVGSIAIMKLEINRDPGVIKRIVAGVPHELDKTAKKFVTFGDTFKAVGQILYRNLITPLISAVGPPMLKAWDTFRDAALGVINSVIKGALTAGTMIKFSFLNLPDIIQSAMIQMINTVLARLAALVKSVTNVIPALQKVLGSSTFSLLEDKAGARLKARATQLVKDIGAIGASNPLGDLFKAVKDQSVKNAIERLTDKGKVKAQADAYARLVRNARQFIAEQELEARVIGMTEQQAIRLRTEQELLNRAKNDNIRLSPRQREELKSLAEQMATAEVRTKGLKEAFDFTKTTTVDFFTDLRKNLQEGKSAWAAFAEAATTALNKIADKLSGEIFGSLFGGSTPLTNAIQSTLGAPGSTNILPFARGGIVNGPTVFPMANGLGLMGEAGPEAVMPLTRGADGKLGVKGGGGGVVVNIANYSSERATQTRSQRGNTEIVDVVIGAVNSGIGEGRLDGSLGGRYGTQPRTRQR